MTVRTSRGQELDMAALAAKNEKTRAVGNMKVNARGDTIDSEGRVIVPVTEKVASGYAQTVGQRSAQQRKANAAPQQPVTDLDLTAEEKQLLNDDISDEELAELKSKDKKK